MSSRTGDLSGPILESEVNAVLSCVSSVPGVSGVENLLTVHKQAGNIPDLQGGRCRTGEQPIGPQLRARLSIGAIERRG